MIGASGGMGIIGGAMGGRGGTSQQAMVLNNRIQ